MISKKILLPALVASILLASCPTPPGPGPKPPSGKFELVDIALPDGFDIALVSHAEVAAPAGEGIPPDYVTAGNAFDITYDGRPSTDFGGELARITLSYTGIDLASLGAKEDFQAWSYDEASARYVVAEACVVDKAAKTVTVYTAHFTVFVITALLPSADGTMILPPSVGAGIASSVSSSSYRTPIFIAIDENYRYYRDRTYYIRQWTDPVAALYSPENAEVVQALGFDGAVGISTINDDKYYTGVDYFSFAAARDLDVYVMYDTRGGGSRFNFSQDAPWLRNGFTVMRDGGGDPYFLQTTDEVAYYSVYHRRYATGEQVRLDGNRRGVSDARINTNYWVIVRPADLGPESSGLDEFIPASARPRPVTNLSAAMDGTDVLLGWTLPTSGIAIDRVLVRRSFRAYPSSPYDGEAPAGTAIGDSGFRDTSVPPGSKAYYAVFALSPDDTPSIPAYVGIIASDPAVILPVVVSTDPEAGSTGVDRGTSVLILFNTPIDPASVDPGRLALRSGVVDIPFSVSSAFDGRGIVLDPVDALPPSSLIQANIDASVSDMNGNAIARDFAFTFTTSAEEPSGGAGIVIDPDMDDPVAVQITGVVNGLAAPASLSLSAALPPSAPGLTVLWFLNGSPAGIGVTVELSSLAAGYYRMDAVVLDLGTFLGSGSAEFEVVE